MKYKTFIYSIIFLTILQLFSPLMVNFSESGINIQKNEVLAAENRAEIKDENADAFLVISGFNDNADITKSGNIEITSYTGPNYKINNVKVEFIIDEKEKGCPSENLTLFETQSLSNKSANSKELSGFESTKTIAQVYLKSVYTNISIPTGFNKSCIENNAGFDGYGHYKFTYEVEDKNGSKVTKEEQTNIGEAIEKIADKKFKINDNSGGVPFVSTQGQNGENFDVSWGLLSTNPELVAGSVKAEQSIFGDKKYIIDKTCPFIFSTNKPTKITLNYLHSGNNTFTFYEYICTTKINKVQYKPGIINGQELYTLAYEYGPHKSVSLRFSLPINGKVHSFKPLWDSSNKNTTNKETCVVDWCLQEFSVNPGVLSKKDQEIYLQAKISILLSGNNVEKFKPFVDRNKDNIASNGDTPGNWVSFLGENSNDTTINIEDRPAKDGNGFYLVWGTENNHTVKDSTHNEINLSPYLFGENFAPSEIIQGKSGMTFEVPVGPLEYGKVYYFKLFGRDAGEGFFDLTNDGYSDQVVKTVDQKLDDITQQAREELISGGETLTNIEWMPSCEPESPSTWFTGCLVVGFYHLVFVPTAYLLTVAGSIMDWVLLYSIKPDAYTVGYIKDSWRFVRDVMNLGFIFMLIYLAFKVMLGVGKGTKQLIVNTVIIATVINFSYPLATVVIDVSNITARQLYYNAFNKKDGDGKPVGLSTMVAAGFNPQRLISGAGEQGKTAEERDNNKGTIFMIILMGVAFNIIAMIIFLKVALQFVYRILGLVFAIILSPVAIFSYSLAPETRSKLKMVGFEEWMSGLIKDSFKAPIFLFLILILALFVNNTPFANMFKDGVDGIDWWMSMLIPFMMIVGFLGLISKITKEMSSSLADLAGGMVMKGIGAVAGVAMGGAALVGSSYIGKAATKLASSEMGQRIMDRAANGSFIAKAQTKILRKAQTGSFDLRQTGIGNAVSKETGANFNALTSKIDSVAGALGSTRGLSTGMLAGGYLAGVDRKNKQRDEFVKMLEYNKSQISDAEDQKDSKEKEKEKAQEQEREHKENIAEMERELRDREEEKRRTDKTYNDSVKIEDDRIKENERIVSSVEKLENLLAKKSDLLSRTPTAPTNELDNQIARLENTLSGGAGGLITTDPITRISTGTISLSTLSTTSTNDLNDARRTKNMTVDDYNRPGGTKDQQKNRIDMVKNSIDAEKDILKSTEESTRNLTKEINALTKSIENIKKNRENAFKQSVRNKSGHIYGRETYQSKMDAKVEAEPLANRAAKRAELEAEFTSTFGNMADEMRNVITSIDSRSNTVNTKYIRNQTIATAALGSAIGLFTGGLAGLAAGAGVGGVVGAARSYQPGNESYGTSHTEWRPEVRDTYTPPTNS